MRGITLTIAVLVLGGSTMACTPGEPSQTGRDMSATIELFVDKRGDTVDHVTGVDAPQQP